VDGEQGQAGSFVESPGVMRKVSGAKTAAEALDVYLEEAESAQADPGRLSDADLRKIVTVALERGNFPLAVSLFDAACSSKASGGQWTWPRASLGTLQEVLVGLAREVQVAEALRVLQVVRAGGSASRNTEVPFGQVVSSPLGACPPLAVVQPDEGQRVVADSESRYEFELFSGHVTKVTSEALNAQQSVLLAVLRAVGAWKSPPVAAVHEMIVQTPGGKSRAFRFATSTADQPAFEGQRATLVCSPSPDAQTRRQGLLSTAPPGTKPGEPLSVCNHSAPGAPTTALLRPPDSTTSLLPAWAPTAAILLAGSEAASYLVDPSIPLLLGAGVATVGASVVAGNALLLPELKRLPEPAVRVEEMRQRLLRQHLGVSGRLQGVVKQAEDDIRDLARLSQLAQKMASVGDASYAARAQRVTAAADALEQRLRKGMELADGYARVLSMIEIEVEMDTEVPQAELADLGNEIEKLEEMEALREEWQVQLEAQDEVERLLRQSPSP